VAETRGELTRRVKVDASPAGCRRGRVPTPSWRWALKALLALGVAVLLSFGALVTPAGATGSPCRLGCRRQTKACAQSAHVSLRSCLMSCGGSTNVTSCRASCMTTFRGTKNSCDAEQASCTGSCPPPTPQGSCQGAFLDTCGQELATCAKGVIVQVKACVHGCLGSAAKGPCFQGCAAAAVAETQQCRDAFLACVGPCRHPTTTTTLPRTSCQSDTDCSDGNFCTVDRCVNGQCEHGCICLDPSATQSCCPGPAALCVHPTTTTLPTGGCGPTPFATCAGECPGGSACEPGPATGSFCRCVSGAGGPCGGNILRPPPVCAPGLVCKQVNPDVTGTCESPTCIPFFTSGCTQTTDCCEPCAPGRIAPCAVCLQGECVGAP
jgi:hypothetical protein